MASLYKKPIVRKDPKTGEKIKTKSKKWWGRFTDELGREKRVPLATCKQAAQTMLNEHVMKVEKVKAGITDPLEDQLTKPVKAHIADFEKHLRSRNVSEPQVKLVTSRCRKIVKSCNWKNLKDISASRVQNYLCDLRKDGLSIQTSNHYLRAIKQFTRWLMRDHRNSNDPLAFLSMLNVETDRRHDRRPLTDDEVSRLLEAARCGKPVRKMSGPDRAILYLVAVYTGLRASELASLTKTSFELDAELAIVTVQAAYSKHRRTDVLPLHATVVERLRPWLAGRADGLVWPGKWARGKEAGHMMKHDLAVAEIPYVDGAGRYADFHALRHTFITNMVKSGIAPKSAQELARHSTIELTMNVYASLTIRDHAKAIRALPEVAELKAES